MDTLPREEWALDLPACAEDALVAWDGADLTCGPARDDVGTLVADWTACPYIMGAGDYDSGLWTAYVCVAPVLPDAAMPPSYAPLDGLVLLVAAAVAAAWKVARR